MSKMTQRRMARRSSRKLKQARRSERFKDLRIGWLEANLSQAFAALAAMRRRNEATPVAVPAAQ